MAANLTEDQKAMLKVLEELEKDYQYQSISQTNLPETLKKQSSSISNPNLNPIQLLDPDFSSLSLQHSETYQKLQSYKKKSQQIIQVSSLLHDYNINFKHLQTQRTDLQKCISQLHSKTSDLLLKQTKYIDLSNAVKEALDYYELLDKFQFNWVCEISAREVFEAQLQPLLSGLADGIQFFTQNANYCNAKKYLNGLVAARTKVCSFAKSFLIKLLTKQEMFLMKNIKNQFPKQIQNFYTKSKPKFLTEYLSCFPQTQSLLKDILIPARQSVNQQESSALLKKQVQIEQFLLNQNTLSLITYMQKNIPDAYEQVILKLISFYRIKFHEAFYRNVDIGQTKDRDGREIVFEDLFRDLLVQVVFIFTCEAAYLEYCFKPCTDVAKEYTRSTLAKITDLYISSMVRIAKQPSKTKNPFKICNTVTLVLQQSQKFLRNYSTGQYQTYIMGALMPQLQSIGLQTLKSIYKKLTQKLLSQLQQACQNMLPKYRQTQNKQTLTQQIKQFVHSIGNLTYCPSQAQKYMISSLDTLIKSIKEVSNTIQSRMECYVWNIQIFGFVDRHLSHLPYHLVKKQLQIDVADTARMFDRVRNVQTRDSLFQYASQLFSVIKTGVPTLSELTLDFNRFIKQYYRDLKQKFLKDMVFIYAKNQIQFLQQLRQHSQSEQQPTTTSSTSTSSCTPPRMCTQKNIRNLHSSYQISLQNYIKNANEMLELRYKQFTLYDDGQDVILALFKDIQEALLDLLGAFYVETSRYLPELVQGFQNIADVRAKFVFSRKKQNVM